ncbi:MAG: Bug family tripartite tricarboxylate transporter substrate binding protein [Pseudomonas sp.]
MSWPNRPVKFVVPYPAGGSPDQLARQIADQMAKQFGQGFVIENKPGASGLLGARAVSQGAADGYSIAYLSSAHVTLQAMNPKFNLLKELKPVSKFSVSPFVCVVNANSPIKTMQDLIKAVQANPGKLTFGSAGPGSPAHMAVEYLEEKVGSFKALHVPYKGAVESINALLGGQVDFSIPVLGTAIPHLMGGKIRALGVTSEKRLDVLPEVPTIAETGVAGYRYEAWGGIGVAAGTPDDIVEKLRKALVEAMNSPEVKAFVAKTGSYVELSPSSKAFAEQIAREVAAEGPIVKRLGLT